MPEARKSNSLFCLAFAMGASISANAQVQLEPKTPQQVLQMIAGSHVTDFSGKHKPIYGEHGVGGEYTDITLAVHDKPFRVETAAVGEELLIKITPSDKMMGTEYFSVTAGAIWGGIAGGLKAAFNINEVIVSLMLVFRLVPIKNGLVQTSFVTNSKTSAGSSKIHALVKKSKKDRGISE